jgi:LuxR family maltose regulon positive regulatory protein
MEALLDVAIVDRVNASLASALTDRVDAGKLLLEAASRGLFVTRLGEGWFELHGVVRTVLRDAVSTSEHAPELHARAAQWYETAGETSLALAHWLQAGQQRAALHLLAANVAELYDRGQADVVRRTIAAIPASVANADVGAMFDFAWSHLLVGQSQFLVAVDQLTWLVQPSTVAPALAGRVTMLRSIAAAMICDWSECASLARQALVEFGDGWRTDPVGRFGWNMVAREAALSESWHDGHPAVLEAQHSLGADAERRLALEGTRALGDVLAGRPVDALRVTAGVRRAVAVSNHSVLLGELAAAEALAHRELGDHDRAFTELTDLAAHRIEPVGHVQLLASLDLCALHIDDGDLSSAQMDFDVARSMVDNEFCGPGGRTWLARLGTLLTLAAGDWEAARGWSEQVDDPFWSGASAARVALAGGDRSSALAAIETAEPRCVRHEVVRNLISSRVVENRDEAIKLATLAAESAFMNGLLQTVASEGIETLELIERTAWRVSADWLDRLRRAAGARQTGGASQRDLQAMLTDRERDVLRFLPSRLTYPEIARELYVSVNTLKFHLKIIYRKLGVRSRTEAAEIARQMALAKSAPARQIDLR